MRPKYLSLEALSPLYTRLGFFYLFFIFFLFFWFVRSLLVCCSELVALLFALSVRTFFLLFFNARVASDRQETVFATFGWVLI